MNLPMILLIKREAIDYIGKLLLKYNKINRANAEWLVLSDYDECGGETIGKLFGWTRSRC